MTENIQKQKLIEAIAFQEGSIVSKQIIKNQCGNLTLFAFDKDESLSEHTSPYNAFVYLIEGEMEIKIGDEIYNITTGEMIVMPANIPHGLKALQKSKMLLVMIK
ncbi:cupin domain-containing protein [Rosettibacter firmus]|uniref:cupin domain-containing protein n=1 Tax=Rosettibacter firmus TaxID=3111522 RepID=UPI00336BFD1D